jgi:4-hydroxybenzoate polyprenyltransferase
MSTAVVDPLDATPARRLGRKLLGPALPYLLHLRPLEWPILAGHTALGWLLAVGLVAPTPAAWFGLLLWVVALNGGTLAINSAYDRDEGDVAYLRHPPPVPRGLATFAMALMLLGLLVAWRMPPAFRLLYGASLAMSVAYSVPPLRLKRVGGADWVINMLGFGTFTPWAGWALSGRPLDLEHGLILWAFCPLFAALYPLTQIYQIDEDRSRGDRTLVLRLGLERSLALAICLVLVAFGLLAAAAVVGRWPGQVGLRGGLLVLALGAWLAVLFPWWGGRATWSSPMHQRGMYHALVAWALTDVAVLLAWGL